MSNVSNSNVIGTGTGFTTPSSSTTPGGATTTSTPSVGSGNISLTGGFSVSSWNFADLLFANADAKSDFSQADLNAAFVSADEINTLKKLVNAIIGNSISAAELDKANHLATAAQVTTQSARQLLQSATDDLNSSSTKIDQPHTAIRQDQQDISNTQSQIANVQSQITNVQSQITNSGSTPALEKQLSDLGTQLSDLRTQLSGAQTKLTADQAELTKQTQKHTSAINTLTQAAALLSQLLAPTMSNIINKNPAKNSEDITRETLDTNTQNINESEAKFQSLGEDPTARQEDRLTNVNRPLIQATINEYQLAKKIISQINDETVRKQIDAKLTAGVAASTLPVVAREFSLPTVSNNNITG